MCKTIKYKIPLPLGIPPLGVRGLPLALGIPPLGAMGPKFVAS